MNPLKILIDNLLKYTKENDKLIENVDKLIFNNILQDGELGEGFINFNRCIKLNLRRIIDYNERVIKNWNTCGNPDCRKLAKRECIGCHNIRYCGKQCQKEHWNKKSKHGSLVKLDHKSFCRGKHLEIGFKKKEFEKAEKVNNKILELAEGGLFNIIYEDDENTIINIDLFNL